jgi:hypothetical protein
MTSSPLRQLREDDAEQVAAPGHKVCDGGWTETDN